MELRVTALDAETLCELLNRSGGSVTPEMIRDDVRAGAPANPDGTLNLVHYTAWLVRELSNRGD